MHSLRLLHICTSQTSIHVDRARQGRGADDVCWGIDSGATLMTCRAMAHLSCVASPVIWRPGPAG